MTWFVIVFLLTKNNLLKNKSKSDNPKFDQLIQSFENNWVVS